jgi:hypothetical protein
MVAQKNIVEIKGKEYELAFPSLRNVKAVEKILGIDFLQDGLGKVIWTDILADETRTKNVLSAILPGAEGLMDELTYGDYIEVVACFFMKTQMSSMTYKGGLESFGNTLQTVKVNLLQKDIPSTSPSTKSQTETGKE